MTIAAAARTLAILGAGLKLAEGRATGTGTDCLLSAAPPGDEPFEGLHMALAEAGGAAVLHVVAAGAADRIAR